MRPLFHRHDPGECIVCGAAHCSCGGGGPIAVVQLPARDAAAAAPISTSVLAPIGDGSDGRSFTTATYRGLKKR